jgi:hypothetical protein
MSIQLLNLIKRFSRISAYFFRDPEKGPFQRHQCSGAARGIRTPDPVITNDVLYQLSYCGLPS